MAPLDEALAAPVLRYQTDLHGNFELIGAPIGYNCEAANRVAPVVGTIGGYGLNSTDSGADIFWRSTNTGAAASNAITIADARTTAKLTLPSGATVHKAYLYWAGNTTNSLEIDTTATIAFIADNGTVYSNDVTADTSYTATTTYYFYESVKDVTSIISAHKSGAYRVSGISTRNFVDLTSEVTAAGWWLIVLYELPSDPLRNLAVFDGMDVVQGNNVAVSASLSGFEVPDSGFDAKLAVVSLEGDTSIAGDSFRFNGNLLSNGANPSNNFFNATRSTLGSYISVVGDLPQLAGTSGSEGNMDFDTVDIKSYLSPGDTTATIAAQSSQDWFWLGFFATSISTYKPNFSESTKTAVDINGDSLVAGDILEYTIVARNRGDDASIFTTLSDPLPSQVTYVADTLEVMDGTNPGSKSDAVGDDEGEYASAINTVYFYLGDGATGTQGGRMAIGDNATVRFQVQINAGFSGPLYNQANIISQGELGDPQQYTPTDGNGGSPGEPPTEAIVDACLTDVQCTSAPELYCFTAPTPNICVECLDNGNCSSPTPYCSPYTQTCTDCVPSGTPPGTEACDGIDNDCDRDIDEGFTRTTFYRDTDGDGYGDPGFSVQACAAPPGFVADDSDCNDTSNAVKPGATETCNGIDDDCDTYTDEGLTQYTYYRDADSDTYGNPAQPFKTCEATVPAGFVTSSTDCDDNNNAVNPAATETCNYIDDDCDGSIDEGVNYIYYRDADGDTYGDAAVSISSCSSTPDAGYVANSTDCDDTRSTVNPGRPDETTVATGRCDGLDNDCDGGIDENRTQNTYYRDADGDGYGDATNTDTACAVPPGYVTNNTDCDDDDTTVWQTQTGYLDIDGDTYTVGAQQTFCTNGTLPSGYRATSAGTDCNDANAAIRPGATELCNGIDDDCDLVVDDGQTLTTYYLDADSDGYGDAAYSTTACSAPAGYVTNNTDCDDDNNGVYPGATELCNGIDDNCAGGTDETFTYGGAGIGGACDGVGECGSGTVECTNLITATCSTNPNGSASQAVPDTNCNNLDDNCNGATDEGYVADSSCFLPGECAAGNAASSCVAGVETGCATGTPAADDASCNNVDDDCNGATDEDYVADSSCFLPGACAAGNAASSCVAGVVTGCATGTPAASDATCDGVDDDCSGAADEDYIADSSCGVGYCNTNNTDSTCIAGIE
ncbi:MAG: DUF11 domain-containing protein, partial [Deltaproteobacteria bacterium]|nr:DUF11 domain-containing protein [Deltaproteobacteria bacterium]